MMGTVSNRLCKHSGFQKALRSIILLQPVSDLLGLPYSEHQKRPFSSGIKAPDFLSSNKAHKMVKELDVTTADFLCRTGPATSPEFDRLLEEAEKAAEKEYDLQNLKELYEVVRPELVSRCLVHSHPFDHEFTWWLKHRTHAMRKREPKFTTSYDIAEHLKGLPQSDWVFFLDYLAESRIAVVEEWIKISTVENIMYHYGLKDFHDIHFCKGEADASYREESKSADLSIVIWDNDQVVKAVTYIGVSDCYSSVQSEAKAAFALLTEAKELGIENLLLWVDNKKIAEIISGKRQVQKTDRSWKLFMALRSMRLLFKRLLVTYVPRELLQIPDSLLRQPSVDAVKTSRSNFPRYVKQSAKQWSYQLCGFPMFELSMTPENVKAMRGFVKPLHGEAASVKWYVEVAENNKLSALHNIIQVLQPCDLYVTVRLVEKPVDLQEELKELVGTSIAATSSGWHVLKSEAASHGKGAAKGRTLMVVYDGFYLEKDLSYDADFVIYLSSEKERAALRSAGFTELSASCFIRYSGACVLGKKVV